MSDTAKKNELLGPDLIDDRVIETEDEDEFRLSDIVEEVSQLCLTASTPATVALYGSWGSGKSSLGRLLEKRLAGSEAVFARFDAFKYAEVPLRRHFISQLAKSFKLRDRKFGAGLYASSKTTDLSIPFRKIVGLIGSLVVAVVVISGLSLIACAVVAALSKGGFGTNFTKALHAAVPGIVLAVPLLGAILAFVGKHLAVETTVQAPSSDEEFERLFRDLVATALRRRRTPPLKRRSRVVVFIDELDRCSPTQVVSVLETLRTFLEVRRCVFVVAADQQVLEHALTEAARQATPFNAANPYYSAGSAYLDKIFQYQLPLPPILPRRLSQYALDLISKREGVWTRVGNRAELVSILIPTHVRSPRRVKTLLNAFALTFRLALIRSTAKTIDEGVASRSAEVAKLVCLRTEFPLFAADLQLDHRLPELVLRLYEGEARDALAKEMVGMSGETFERAVAYSQERLPVAEVIARDPHPSAPLSKPAADGAEEDAGEEADTSVVAVSHARQLIRYLQRTREIEGPSRDLIFLEGSGAAVGLPPEVAETLESDAVDGRVANVVATISSLDRTDQERSFRLLARLVVEALGVESRNVVGAIYKAIESGAEVGDAIDDVLNSLVTYGMGRATSVEDLPAALKLAILTDSQLALQLRDQVLSRAEFETEGDLILLALREADALGPQSHHRLAELLVAALDEPLGQEAEEALQGVSDTTVEALLTSATVPLSAATGLVAFIDALIERKRKTLAVAATRKLAELEREEAQDDLSSIFPGLAPITDRALAKHILDNARKRPAPEWKSWLDSLDPDEARHFTNLSAILGTYIKRLWQARFAPTSGQTAMTADEFADVAASVMRLNSPASEIRYEDETEFLDPSSVTRAAGVATRSEMFDALRDLADVGAVPRNLAASRILDDLAVTLGAAPPPLEVAALTDFVTREAGPSMAKADTESRDRLRNATENSSWLTPQARNVLLVQLAVASHANDPSAPGPSPEVIAELVASEEEIADEAIAEWLREFEPKPQAVFEAVAPRLVASRRLRDPLASAVVEVSTNWTPDDRANLLHDVSGLFVARKIDGTFIKQAGLPDADPDRIADEIEQRYREAKTNPDRERAIELWRALDPAPERVVRRLVDSVYVPLLGEGVGAAKIALDHFTLVRDLPVKAAQDRVKKALRDAVDGTKLAKRTNRVLGAAGWISEKRRWLKLPL